MIFIYFLDIDDFTKYIESKSAEEALRNSN